MASAVRCARSRHACAAVEEWKSFVQSGRQRRKVRLNYLGQHNIANALGAAALSLGFGASLPAVRRGLEKVRPFSMRMQIEELARRRHHQRHLQCQSRIDESRVEDARRDPLAAAPTDRGARRYVRAGQAQPPKSTAIGSRGSRRGARWTVSSRSASGPSAPRRARMAAMGAEQVVIGESHGDIARRLRERVKCGDWLFQRLTRHGNGKSFARAGRRKG